MSQRRFAVRNLLGAIALLPVLGLTGCGDSVQYNGRVFEMMGLSGGGNKPRDARVTDRAPLVLPPDAHRLPPPGSQAAAIGQEGLPDDVDQRRRAVKAEADKKKKQAGYTDGINDPTAEARPGILNRLLKGKKDDDDAEAEDVPEPDPSDAPVRKTTAR